MNNIVSTILIVAGLGLSFGYTYPLFAGTTGAESFSDKSVQELRLDQVRFNEALDRAREIEDIRTGLLTKYNSISEEDRKKIVKLLPDHIDSVRLIIDINNIAEAYGMSLNNIKLADDEKEQTVRRDDVGIIDISAQKEYSTKVLDFSLNGPYGNFIAFLKDTERSLRLVDIIQVDIDTSDNESESGTYDYNVSLKTYYLNVPKQ